MAGETSVKNQSFWIILAGESLIGKERKTQVSLYKSSFFVL